jgi:Na+-driven multidrug efflux pump
VLALNALLVLALTLGWLNRGLTGVGLAWLVGQGVTSVAYLVLTVRSRPVVIEPRGAQA